MRRIICVLTSRVPVCARGLGDGSDALANIPPPHTDASDSSALELLSETAKKRLDQAIKEAGKAPSSQERAKIQHMLMPIANHIATRLLYTEVAERARANPKSPGHQAMEHVLNSKGEMSEIEATVKNKLVNIHSGAWAQEVSRLSICPCASVCMSRLGCVSVLVGRGLSVSARASVRPCVRALQAQATATGCPPLRAQWLPLRACVGCRGGLPDAVAYNT